MALPLSNLQVIPTTPAWTLEFWILMSKTKEVGDIVSIEMADATKLNYKETSTRLLKYQITPPGSTETVLSVLTSLDFTQTYWKKMIVTYNNGAS